MKIHKPSQLVFASIPLFFGIQQIAEGTLWLSLPNPEYILLQKFATFIFVIMAQVLWPIMIPLSVLCLEQDQKRKNILSIFLVLGLLFSLYIGYCLTFYNITPKIENYHIQYYIDFPESFILPAFIAYITATIIPPFISTVKRVNMLGVSLFLSCLVTLMFFTQYLVSVWCFFAAIISGVILWILIDSNKEFKLNKLILLESH